MFVAEKILPHSIPRSTELISLQGKKKQKIYVLHRIRLQCTRLHTDPKNLHHHCKLPIEINFFFCHQMFAVSSLN